MFLVGPAPTLADAWDHRPGIEFVVTDHATERPLEADRERFARRHQLGKTGVNVMYVGLGTLVVGSVLAVTASTTEVFIGGSALAVAGSIAFNVGEVMMFVGGIGAASVGRDIGLDLRPDIGWIGVGLLISGVVLNSVGYATQSPTLTTLGGVAGISGFVCGAVQLGQVGRQGRDAGLLSVLPTPNGAVVVTRL